MLASPAPITLRQYTDANIRITDLFDSMHEVINVLDYNHAKGKALRNTRDLFPMADGFVRNVTDATHNIHEAYVDYIQKGSSARDTEIIEKEADRIFNEIRKVILQARKLDVHPVTEEFKYIDEPNFDNVQRGESYEQKKRIANNTFRTKQGPIQTAIFEEARRLGPEYGAHFLLGVEDTFLATLEMLHAIKEAGIPLDVNLLPNVEATPEMWGESAGGQKSREVAHYITQMYGLIDAVSTSIIHEDVNNSASQSAIAQPFIEQIKKSIDTLAGHYKEYAEEGKPLTQDLQNHFEQSFSNIFVAIKEITDEVEEKLLANKSKVMTPVIRIGPRPSDDPVPELVKQFELRPRKGALRSQLAMLQETATNADGRLLLKALDDLVCQAAGIIVHMEKLGLLKYKNAIPLFGTASTMSRKAAMAEGFQEPDDAFAALQDRLAPKGNTAQ